MNIKRLLKAYLLVALFAGTLTALLFLLQYFVLNFPIFFEWVGKTLLILFISSPFVAVAYSILKKLEN
jgi:hypothetical protein|tara:strand:+ start:43 stop:246 length:204 start_codon:yes stop_codon:yes gene_type:complete